MRKLYLILRAGIVIGISCVNAEELGSTSVEQQLRQQLKAERALNEQLRRRVEMLERQQQLDGAPDSGSLVPWDVKPEMEQVSATEEMRSAVEESLVVRGLILPPPGTCQLTPGFSWLQDGAADNRRDSYVFDMQLQYGLPHDFAAKVVVPYIKRDWAAGSRSGLGDITFGLRRKLIDESETLPSLVARLDYTHDTGSHAFQPVPVASGFRSFEAGLAAMKSFAPLIVSGRIAYDRAFQASGISIEDNGVELFQGDIKRGDGLSLGMSLSLAVTPDISLDTGLTMRFQDGARFYADDGTFFRGASTRSGYINIGFGAIMTQNLYLYLSTAAGITDDAGDVVFSVSIPYYF